MLFFFDSVDDLYGVEEAGLTVENDEGVHVPKCNFFLEDAHFVQLQLIVDPLAHSADS